jgi:hypothetical protein
MTQFLFDIVGSGGKEASKEKTRSPLLMLLTIGSEKIVGSDIDVFSDVSVQQKKSKYFRFFIRQRTQTIYSVDVCQNERNALKVGINGTKLR